MTPESPTDPRQALEASLTAMLLGELPDDQVAFLQQAIASDPELARMHERLKVTIGLVRETAATPIPATEAQAAPLKLSEERRQVLLQRFKTVEPKVFAWKRHRKLVLELAAAAAVLAVLASVFLPITRFSKHRNELGGLSFRTWSLSSGDAVPMRAQPAAGQWQTRYEREAAAVAKPIPESQLPAADREKSIRLRLQNVQPATRPATPASSPIFLPTSGELADANGATPVPGAAKDMLGGIPALESHKATTKSEYPTVNGGYAITWGSAQQSQRAGGEQPPVVTTASPQPRNAAAPVAVAQPPSVAFSVPQPDPHGVHTTAEAVTAAPALALAANEAPATPRGQFAETVSAPSVAPQFSPPAMQSGLKNSGDIPSPTLGGDKERMLEARQLEIAAEKSAPLAAEKPAPVFKGTPQDVADKNLAFRERYGLVSSGQTPSVPARRGPALTQSAAPTPIDPNTGLPISAAGPAVDPNTGLPISTPAPEVVPLYTRVIKVDTNAFVQGLESIVGFDWGAVAQAGNHGGGGDVGIFGGGGHGGGLLSVPRVNFASSGPLGGVGDRGSVGGQTNDSEHAQAMARQFFLTMGLDLKPPKTLEYNQRDGTLTVRGTADDLDTVKAAAKSLSAAVPADGIRSKFSEVSQNDNRALGFDWYLGNLLASTNAVKAQGGTAPAELSQFAQDRLAEDKAKVLTLGDIPAGGALFRSDSKVVLPPTEAPAGTATDALVRNGRALYESGKIAEAQAVLRQAIKQEPQNQVALNKRTVALTNGFVAVENAWTRTNLITTSSPRQAILNKLDHIRLDSVGFDGLPLSEALKMLTEESKKRDPEHRGINFLINEQQNESLSSTTIKIVPPLHNMRLADVLDAINKVADPPIKYWIGDYAVVFSAPRPVVYVDGDAEAAKRRQVAPIPEPQPENQTHDNAFSTFSMNVSDVSFKLAAASLEKGQLPDPASIRSEEFINAFDYRDPEAPAGAPIAFAWERGRYPFAQGRDLLRFSIKTAAQGRQAGRPLNLVLLLDNSGSMERADRVQIIHEALRVLAAQLSSNDVFSVVTFARTPRLWVDGAPGSQAAQVAEEVSGLTPQGGTNLGDALDLAYQTALRHYLANGINRLVLLTDGAANLGDVDPDSLKKKVEANRKQGIALDCFGIGWEGYNDDLLEVLTRNADGRYGFINTPAEAATEFAGQLAGALQVAASDVKVQVEFNPNRVTAYRQIGYAKLQLTKEQFRDNTVNAAQIGAAETGNALYVIEVNGGGDGPLGTVRVRYRVPGTQEYREQEWVVPYNGSAPALEQSSPALRLAATASAFSEWLATSPYAGEVTPDRLLGYLSGVPEVYGVDTRPKKLEWMIRQAKSLAGK